MLVSTAVSLAIPLVAGRFVDAMGGRGGVAAAVGAAATVATQRPLLAWLALLLLLPLVASFLFSVVSARLALGTVTRLRRRLFAHLLELPALFFAGQKAGDLSTRVTGDVGAIQYVLTSGLVALARALLTLAGALVLMFRLNARLSLVVVLLIPATILLVRLFGTRLRRLSRRMFDGLGQISSHVQETVGAIATVKVHNSQAHEKRRFEALVAVEQVPTQFWRSVGHSHNGFILNGAIDELAALGGRDPYELRRELLADKPRHLAVLEKAATEAGWGKPLPAGHFHGIALQESFGSIVAEVVEASVTDGTTVKVHRVTAAVDCGFAVNPQQVVAQIQGGVIFGMSMALYNQITLQDGVIQQDNFDTYPIVRLEEVPQIDVHIVENGGPLGGIGEPGLPPFAPALAGAIFAATGKRIRRLPLSVALA